MNIYEEKLWLNGKKLGPGCYFYRGYELRGVPDEDNPRRFCKWIAYEVEYLVGAYTAPSKKSLMQLIDAAQCSPINQRRRAREQNLEMMREQRKAIILGTLIENLLKKYDNELYRKIKDLLDLEELSRRDRELFYDWMSPTKIEKIVHKEMDGRFGERFRRTLYK